MTATILKAENLSLGYHDRTIIRNLDIEPPAGSMTAIIGPNGCGKSTLLRALARLIRPTGGRVTLDGQDIHTIDTRSLARRIAILPQAQLAPDGISVFDLVRRGRAPWRNWLSSWTEEDQTACTRALEAVDMSGLAERAVNELSGGQRQRVWIALILAQQTSTILLDEPTTWLDLPHQIEVLSLLRRLNRETGATVINVLHDLNLAARFSDHLILLGSDGLVAVGEPVEVLTKENLMTSFGLAAHVSADPVHGSPLVVAL